MQAEHTWCLTVLTIRACVACVDKEGLGNGWEKKKVKEKGKNNNFLKETASSKQISLISFKCLWNEQLRYWKIGEFERPLKVKKNGVFLFVISHLVPKIFKIFVLGTDDVIRCDDMEVKTQSREYLYK